jgi:CheY-like chemotaxis protein
LESSGYKVDVASNGREGLDLLEKNEYALVLMDCSMPVMDGYVATAMIRDPSSKVKNHRIAIIGVTGYAQQEDHNKCLAVGMNDYLCKPIRFPDLKEKIERWTSIAYTVIN